MSSFPEAPPNLKTIQPYLKIAIEHDTRDIIVAYWARVYCLQVGIKSAKLPDEKQFLLTLMDWLENIKKSNKENDSIVNDTVAQAYLENYAHKLFTYADRLDRAGNFGKNVVKSFYTSAMLYDIISTFGELSDEAAQCKKYAKWKATYINNCLKNGETPHAGPMNEEGDDQANSDGMGWDLNPTGPSQPTQPFVPEPSTSYNPNPAPPTYTNIDAFNLPDPPKDPEPKHPGGFVPYQPSGSDFSNPEPESVTSTSARSPEEIMKAQKFCKYATSALNYDDVPTAIDYLQKCLNLLKTGHE